MRNFIGFKLQKKLKIDILYGVVSNRLLLNQIVICNKGWYFTVIK